MESKVKAMMADWNEKKAPFVARQQEIETRLTELRTIREEQVLAQKIVLTGKATEATALGEFAKAEEMKAEIAALEAGKILRSEEREILRAEQEELDVKIKSLADQAFGSHYPAIQQSCFDAAARYVDYLDATWQALQEYQALTGCRLTTDHRIRFCVTDHSPNRELFERLRRWGLA
jgi:hypothetical protein